MFTRRQFKRYWGCFYGAILQALCDRWEADEDEGRFRVVNERYQFEGVLVQMYAGLVVRIGEKGRRVLAEMMERDGVEWEERHGWLGRRIKWGG
jgi:hypothetical protein